MVLSDAEQRALEEHFLIGVRERIALDITAIERGLVPKHWDGQGPVPPEALAKFRTFHQQLEDAIAHVRAGGALDEVPDIMWGRNR